MIKWIIIFNPHTEEKITQIKDTANPEKKNLITSPADFVWKIGKVKSIEKYNEKDDPS